MPVAELALPSELECGYATPPTTPARIIEELVEATRRAIASFEALPAIEDCNDAPGYDRVKVTIPLPPVLFNQLMNGASGYRAHYSVSVETGERFNSDLVKAIIPLLIEAQHIYEDQFSRTFCERSLSGSFTKLWYAKQLTDFSNRDYERLPEVIKVRSWQDYSKDEPKPHKGLMAPLPAETSVLLNGTFVDANGKEYEQKPGRSKELNRRGWV